MGGGTLQVVPKWMMEELFRVDPRWMGGGTL